MPLPSDLPRQSSCKGSVTVALASSPYRARQPMMSTDARSPEPGRGQPPPRDGELAGRTILVVEDDTTVAEVVQRYLERDGADVVVVGDGAEALAYGVGRQPDLVVLDLLLPGLDGWEICRRLQLERDVPVVMLSALSDADDRLVGLDLGADDYLGKPFSARELVARVRAVLRRVEIREASTAAPVEVGSLVLDPAARRVTRDDHEVALTAREFDLLAFFLRNPGVAFRRDQLLEQVWGYRHGDRSTVTVYIRRLREKLEPDPSTPRLIQTVWGVGYRLEGPGR